MPDTPNKGAAPQGPAAVPEPVQSGQGLFADAPADAAWDDIFATGDGAAPATNSQPTDNTPGVGAAAPQASTPEAPFLQSEHSVYKTAEEAIKGTNEKDALIDQLRSQLETQTGHDPITGRPDANIPQSYLQNPAGYVEALSKAVQDGDAEAYAGTQTRLMDEYLAPIAPLLSHVAKTNAVQSVGSELQGFSEFMGGDSYKETLDAVPELGEAIEAAESNLALQSKLPQLYKLAYFADRGRRLPEIMQASASQGAPAAPVVETSRTQAPPAPTTTPIGSQSSVEAIRAQIKELEARGVDKLKF